MVTCSVPRRRLGYNLDLFRDSFMWFKNLRAYRLSAPFDIPADKLGQQLADMTYKPCSASQALSMGWVPPLGEAAEDLVHAANGRILLCMRREEKLLPATVVREQLEAKIAEIEKEQARRIYRKERLTLKDEIVQDCLPRAFSRSTLCYAVIDTGKNWILVDAASASRAEELLNLLRDCIGSFPVLLPQVNNAPTATMTSWLVNGRLPEDLALGSDCELREPGEEGGVVRCRGVDLLSEEVEVHLNAGKQVARLSLEWEDRLSLVLSEDLVVRRMKFADELLKANEDIPEADPMARLDADFVLLGEAVSALQERVMSLFGGEAEPG